MSGMERAQAPWRAWLARSGGWHMIDEIDLVATIAAQCDWLHLCARLEALADCLPARLPADETMSVSAELRRLVGAPRDAFVATADLLFGQQMGVPLIHSLIGHVTARHAARTDQVYDLIEALDPRTDGDLGREALGYMLRCMFESCRQIVALERLTLLELGAERLTSAARALLTERIIECCEV